MIGRHSLKCLVLTSAVLAVTLSVTAMPASATTPGWIDTSYGVGGAAVVPGGVVFGVTTVDALGRSVVMGPTSADGTGAKISRLTAGGKLDASFGTSGTTALTAAVIYTRVAIDPAGLVYVLGSNAATGSPSNTFVVTRLTVDGAFDSNFGTGGTATILLPAGVPPFVSNAFAVRNDGDVVVSLATLDAQKRGYLAALTPAGQLDAAFGPAGSTPPGLFQLPNKTFVYKLTAAPAPIAPVFTASTPPLTANVAVAYHYTFAASGRPAPVFSVASGSLPSGLTLDPVTGVLSGTPDTLGDSTFTIKAANGTSPAAVTMPITIHVAPTPAAPVFTAAAPPSAAKTGVAYTYTFAATGQPAPTFSIATGTLPTGLTLNATTGVLSGTPTAGGVFTFTVKAANGVSPDAVTPSLTINVAAPPVFTAVTPPGAKKGSAYSYTFTASGNPAPTFSIASGSIPTGLTLNSTTGVLSGTPSAAGQFSFTVKAANGVTPNAVSNTITITVADLPVSPVFTAATPPSTATVGVPYSYTFAANGNPAPKFTAIGTLPTGLTLNATTGVLSGTPTTAHRFVFEVKAANGVKPDKITPLITITVTRAAAAAAADATLAPAQPAPARPQPPARPSHQPPARPSLEAPPRPPTRLRLPPSTPITMSWRFLPATPRKRGCTSSSVTPAMGPSILRSGPVAPRRRSPQGYSPPSSRKQRTAATTSPETAANRCSWPT